MLLIDLNQVLLSGVLSNISDRNFNINDERLFRHLILNIIRSHVKSFKKEYGEVVLCCDSRRYWRKEYFPYYKANRKQSRERSELDWNHIFDMLNKFKSELKIGRAHV